MKKHRFGWGALTLFYLFLRFQNTPGVLTDHGVVFPDTDPYYRLHRIESMVKGDLRYPLHDSKLNFPGGFDVPWPTGLDLAFALPFKLAGVRSDITIQVLSAVAVPILSLPTLWLTGYAATQLGGTAVGYSAGLLLSLFPGHIQASDVGSLDHHFLEALVTILALALWIRLRKGKPKSSRFFLLLLLGLAPSFWPQAWVIGLFLGAAFLTDSAEENFKKAGELFFASSLLSLVPLALSDRFASGYPSPLGFSWWTPFLYSALSVLFAALGAFRRDSRKNALQALVWIVPYFAAIAIFLLIKNGAGVLFSHVRGSWNTLEAARGVIVNTSEAGSPFRIGPAAWFWGGYYFLFLSWIWLFLTVRHRERWGWAAFALIPLLLALVQLRFFPLAAPIVALGTSLLIASLVRNRIAAPSFQSAILLLGTVAVALPCMSWPRLTHQENAHPFFVPVRGASRFVAREKERLHLPPSQSAVASSWDFGHWILHDTDSPVVGNPFQSPASVETMKLFLERDVAPLEDFFTQHPVRYLFVEAPTGRMFRWMKLLGQDSAPFFSAESGSAEASGLKVLPAFYDLLLPRFFFRQGEDSHGESPSHWRVVFVSPFASPDDPTMPALKVFERVPGAHLMRRSRAKQVLLTAVIQTHGGSFVYRQTAIPDASGKVEWVVPYACVNQNGVSFSGRYTVMENQRNIPTPVVLEDAVLSGATLIIR